VIITSTPGHPVSKGFLSFRPHVAAVKSFRAAAEGKKNLRRLVESSCLQFQVPADKWLLLASCRFAESRFAESRFADRQIRPAVSNFISAICRQMALARVVPFRRNFRILSIKKSLREAFGRVIFEKTAFGRLDQPSKRRIAAQSVCLQLKPLNNPGSSPGLPDLSWCNIPKREKIHHITIKYTKWPLNIPNGRKIDQMTIKSSIARYSKIYSNWDFWFGNMPSGNPDLHVQDLL
jgi:hypothetical protein